MSRSNSVQCDVLVVGSGAAGLAAAVTARALGLDVLVVEKEPVFAARPRGRAVGCGFRAARRRSAPAGTIRSPTRERICRPSSAPISTRCASTRFSSMARAWPPKGGPDCLTTMESTIYVPAKFSPLQ